MYEPLGAKLSLIPPSAGIAVGGPAEAVVSDKRKLFADITKMTPRNDAVEKAFLASKIHMVRTHPSFPAAMRKNSIAELLADATPSTPTNLPVPGGVGYGMFYNGTFKTNWINGTALSWEIICPAFPGGNVDGVLYITATNRSAMGVEALIAYVGETTASFMVYDWARPPAERWSTGVNIPFANLAIYLRTESAHGFPYQVLPLLNVTEQTAEGQWTNQVWLKIAETNNWDLVYQFDYAATLADQQNPAFGSWGPIIETFQNSYEGTNPMGTINTQLMSRDQNNQWGTWHMLGPSDALGPRADNVGFNLLFLDPDSSWAVNS